MQIFLTAIIAALLVTISLKGLHFFDFIPWNPVSFLKKFEWFEWSAFERWVILFLILAICAAIITFVGLLLFKAPPFLFSLILGLAIALIFEWQILNLPIEWASVKKLSIPFIIVVLTITRFLIETAHYMKQEMFR